MNIVTEAYHHQNFLNLFPEGDMAFLSEREEVALFENLDCAAKEKILNSHVRLVVKLCRDYAGYGVDLEDLISEGCIGLYKAMNRFDHQKGARFSYYCVFWVKQAVINALANQSRQIRLPTGATIEYLKILKCIKAHKEEFAEEPPVKTIAKKTKISERRVAYIMVATRTLVSLNALISFDEDERTFSDVIEDETNISPAETLEASDSVKRLNEFINRLTHRERIVLRNRFGLASGEEKTLAEIGKNLELTRERVRQIEAVAISKLKQMFKKGT